MKERTSADITLTTPHVRSIDWYTSTIVRYLNDEGDRLSKGEWYEGQDYNLMLFTESIHLAKGTVVELKDYNGADIYIHDKRDFDKDIFAPLTNDGTEEIRYEASEEIDVVICTWASKAEDQGHIEVIKTEVPLTYDIPITTKSVRTVKLMEEDSITLCFSLYDAVFFPVGTWCEDELFGKFYVCEEYMPRYNKSTCGFDYELKMHSWYYLWNLKIASLIAESTEVYTEYNGGQIKRKVAKRHETEWHLTNTLREQAREFMKNLQVLGFVSEDYDFKDDSTLYKTSEGTQKNALDLFVNIHTDDVPKYQQALLVDYSSMYMLDVLKKLTETWECEYWVDGTEENFVIHFGKCIYNTEDTLSLDTNVESMEINKDNSNYGQKLFVFGGEENLPYSYRKKLIFHTKKVSNGEESKFAIDKDFKANMFLRSSKDNDATQKMSLDFANVYKGEKKDGKYIIYDFQSSNKEYEITYRSDLFFLPVGTYKSRTKGYDIIYLGTLVPSNWESNAFGKKLKYTVDYNINLEKEGEGYTVKTISGTETGIVDEKTDLEDNSIYFEMPPIEITYPDEIEIREQNRYYWTVSVKYKVEWQSGKVDGKYPTYTLAPFSSYTFLNVNLNFTYQPDAIEVDGDFRRYFLVTIDDNKYICVLNPNNVDPSKSLINKHNSRLVRFYTTAWGTINESWAKTIGLWNGTSNGGEYKDLASKDIIVVDTYEGLIPNAYYTTDMDNPFSILTLGTKRLQLPKIDLSEHVEGYLFSDDKEYAYHNGYIIPSELLWHDEDPTLREVAIAFDDIYPDGKLRIKSVRTTNEKIVQSYEGETEKDRWDWHQYHIQVTTASGEEFVFDKDYILKNEEELMLRFLIPEDVKDVYSTEEYAKLKAQCKLSGMQFKVDFNNKTTKKWNKKEEDITEESPDTTESYAVEQVYTLVPNEDFGAKLPNDILYPTVDDPCVLVGWNIKALNGLGLIQDAEQRLLQRGFEYAKELKEGNFTFTCNMMSDYMFNLVSGNRQLYVTNANGEFQKMKDVNDRYLVVSNSNMETYAIPPLGQRVLIKHSSLSKGKKSTRIIAMELKFDKPYDTPKFTCGETDTYSRLKQLEKKITKLSN